MTEILTDAEVSVLNAARTILGALRRRADSAAWGAPSRADLAQPTAQDFGRVSGLAEVAEWDIFQVLNTVGSHSVRRLTEAQIHNRSEESDGER